MKQIPSLRDVGYEQMLDYPSVEVTIDREKAGLSGATVEDVAHALVMATSSTRFTNLNYWIDVKTGFDYLVQMQVPPLQMEKPEDVEVLPLGVGQSAGQFDDSRRGDGQRGGPARRARPRHVAALRHADGERRRRGHGSGLGPRGRRHRGGRHSAPRRPRRADGPTAPDDRHVQGPRYRAGRRGIRDRRAAHRLFPIAAPGPGVGRRPCRVSWPESPRSCFSPARR